VDIEANIAEYLGARSPADRYASFDYCFNYFQAFREERRIRDLAAPSALQMSCLQLAFYLASWGMYRGSADLLRRSVRHLVPLVRLIAAAPEAVWHADADDYSGPVRALIIDTANDLRGLLSGGMSDTLVTKVMLGVFGCVPAFDTNFRTGARLGGLGHASLEWVGRFYRENAEVIDRHRVPTIDFDTGLPTTRRYTRAKVIDMVFFIEGSGS
jgi:hypothetical protein